jgi:PAS domain S-box-containing protein
MTLPSELQRPPARATAATATAAAPAGRRDPAFAAAAGPPLWAGAVAALALLHAANPAAWGDRAPHLWVPAAGLGLCLVAWFGPRAAALVAVSQLLVVAQAVALGCLSLTADKARIALTAGEALLAPAEILAAWGLYHHLAKGSRNLGDPRSAILFLFLVVGLVLGGFALVRAVLWWAAWVDPGVSFWRWLAWQWLGRGLGVLTVAPPLLAAVTPWLIRHHWAVAEETDERQVRRRDHVGAERIARGDWIEVAGLALGASVLGIFLAYTHLHAELSGWQLWGSPLLLIVWASMRQGLRGGTIIAAAAASFPLLVLDGANRHDLITLLLQGNLLAQCATGLLVAASASWVRMSEARYRQMVGHVPVVVYSGRILEPGVGNRPPLAEVTLVSAASGRLFGCAPDELLGDYENWLQRVHPEDHVVVVAALTQLARQDQPVTCEYRLRPQGLPQRPGQGDSVAAAMPGASLIVAGSATPVQTPRVRYVRDTLAPRHDDDGSLVGWDGVVTDITEQRLLADDLRRTTNMFHTLVANLPAGVFFVAGSRGRPIVVNSRARQLLGQREDSSAGLEHMSQVYRLHRPDGTPYPVEELPVYLAFRRGQTTMRDDIVVHRPDGRRLPLVAWGAPVALGPGAAFDAAVWVFEDLTALHQAEAARRDTEGRLRAVVETMGEGLVVQDRTGVIVDGNQAACNLFRVEPERLRGEPLYRLGWALLREDGTPLPREEYPAQQVLRGGSPVRNLVLGLRPERAGGGDPDGPPGPHRTRPVPLLTRWVLVNAMPLGSPPQPAGVVTTFSDITAYRHAQEVVRQSEEKYRGLVEALPLMLIVADRDLRLAYLNPATTQITGYELHEVSSPQTWLGLIRAEDRPALQAVIADALGGRSGRVELRYRAKGGEEKVAFALMQPRRQDKEVVGLVALLVDMTRERRLEQELQRSQRLELIGRLSSGIVHDFNNMLTVVMNCADLAAQGVEPNHPVHEDLRQILEASQRAKGLAAQLLAFSKNRKVETTRFDLNGLVRRTLELLRSSLPPAVRTEALLHDGELPIDANETQLQQVLMNLCLNARDAMPKGGRLEVRTELVTRDGRRWVRLAVRDEGHGMSESVRAKIFDVFFTTKEHGTGLGLAVVQQIVESYGGRVEVSSEAGKGATFEVWLPLA